MRDDLKAAWRSLLSSKTFTAVALIVLALGIGASTAIFSVVDAVVLRGLPFDEHDRLVAVGERRPPGPIPDPNRDPQAVSSASPQNYMDWAAQQQVFESFAAIASGVFTLREPGAEPEDLRAQRATAQFFDVLRTKPAIGRVFTSENEVDGRHRVAVLSDGLWRRRFGGDASIVGRTIPLEGGSYEILGDHAGGFPVPVGAVRPTDLWVPYVVPQEERIRNPNTRSIYLSAIARLKPGVSVQQAQAQMDQIAKALETAHPVWNKDNQVGCAAAARSPGRRTHQVLDADAPRRGRDRAADCLRERREPAAGACHVARARGRHPRRAGGGPVAARAPADGRESCPLDCRHGAWPSSSPGGAFRCSKARCPRACRESPPSASISGCSARRRCSRSSPGMLFGIFPALQLSRPDLTTALKDGSRGTIGAGRQRLRSALVVLEVALAVVLLVGAALFIGSFVTLMRINPGFDPENVLTIQLVAAYRACAIDSVDFAPQFTQIVEQVSKVPGVAHASVICGGMPLGGSMSVTTITVPGKKFENDDGISIRRISPEYFKALQDPPQKRPLFRGHRPPGRRERRHHQ